LLSGDKTAFNAQSFLSYLLPANVLVLLRQVLVIFFDEVTGHFIVPLRLSQWTDHLVLFAIHDEHLVLLVII
jgi:hypothetical protein